MRSLDLPGEIEGFQVASDRAFRNSENPGQLVEGREPLLRHKFEKEPASSLSKHVSRLDGE
jgi:hypothetical protein